MNHSVSTMTGKTKVKIVFLGSQAVGKSSIIQKYTHNRFQETANPTVGIDFLAKNITHKAKNYRLQLWDTAGQQRFRSLIPSYLKDANCALIIFDVTSKNTLEEVQMWANLFNENKGGDGFVFVVGNKIDLQNREVTETEAKEYCQKMGVPYFQISAKTGDNVTQLFLRLVQYSTQKNNQQKIPTSSEKKNVIREQNPKQQQQVEKEAVLITNYNQNLKSVENENQKERKDDTTEVKVNENVVLKNQKITGEKKENRQKCC